MTKSIARTKRARLSRLGLAGSMLLFCACAVSPAISGLSSAGAPSAFGPPATSANPSPNPSETAAPQASYNEAEFWDRFGGTEMQSTFDSLSDIVAASDVVVVATVSDVGPGRKILVPETGETEYMASMTLSIDDVIRGSVTSPAGAPGVIQVETLVSFNPPGSILDALIQSAPKGRQVLLFLGNRTADVLRHGLPATNPAAAKDEYFLLTGIEGYILNVGDKAQVSRLADADWLQAMNLRAFGDIVDDARKAVAG